MGTQYAATIAPFKRSKDGRGALLALKAQFAGPAHWDREVKQMNEFLLNNRWTGTTAFTLQQWLAKHRAAFNTLQRCADHVLAELPNERTRFGYVLDNIDCNNNDVAAALSSIRLDDTTDPTTGDPTGMRNDFESAVAFLLPRDPVKKKKSNKRTSAQISATAGGDTGEKSDRKKKKVTFRPAFGKTGVELRYHKLKEWNKLTPQKQDEIKEWRKQNQADKDKDKSPKSGNFVNKSTVSAMIAAAATQKEKEKADQDEFKRELMNSLQGMVSSQVAALVGNSGGARKTLQRAGVAANVSGTEAEQSKGGDDSAERAAEVLMSKFNSIGTKASGKSG
jgi:hypothetical protein